MITADRYRQITGDFTSADAEIDRCVTDAQELLEEYLDRPLARAERTEAMRPDSHGRTWPKATPFDTPDGYEVDGLAIVGAAPFGVLSSFIDPTSTVSITYTGGWADPREETPTGPDLPTCIQRDLAWAAHRLAHPAGVGSQVTTPAGATSVRLGDAAVTYGPSGAPAPQETNRWWSKQTKGYRWAPVHSRNDRHVQVYG
jgi:hypothetical protein